MSKNEQQISTNCAKQEELRKLLDERLNSTSRGLSDISAPGQGLTIESVLIGQAKYIAAIQLANRPAMTFNGDLDKYVQFVTMFRTTFDNVIKDSSALYNLLTRHVTGPAKQAIVPCVYSTEGVNRYEAAMSILKVRYVSQNCVINAHKKFFDEQ